ncbi:MAG: DUF4317 domain-containing protein [Lachnospiraceae bacterium]|nr:DUF4317 domain-containing protein [Lachnospiraceae bacterium]
MNKKDVLELRRRLKKETTNIDRLAGCYVDGSGKKVVKFNESFLNLETVEFAKYLEIAKKTLSGTIGNNILELDISSSDESGDREKLLNGIRSDGLNNEDLLDTLYDLMIQGYHHDGNFLILVFHDTYDVMKKTSDNIKLDESEEVYEYILVALCPVDLSKPGLSYHSDENRIGARIRDWVVAPPEIGFLYPAFDDRSADIHKIDYFVKDPKDSHPDFIEDVLGCNAKRTAVEKRNTFSAIVKHAYADNDERGKEVLLDLQESLNLRMQEDEEESESVSLQPVGDALIDEILAENEIGTEKAGLIKDTFKKEFADEEVTIGTLVDTKALKASLQEKEKRDLVKKVASLTEELKKKETETIRDSGSEAGSASEGSAGIDDGDYDVIINTDPETASEIQTRYIDDRRYILIPAEETLHVKINGEDL